MGGRVVKTLRRTSSLSRGIFSTAGSFGHSTSEWPEYGWQTQMDQNGPNTVSESTVSNTELSELFGAH